VRIVALCRCGTRHAEVCGEFAFGRKEIIVDSGRALDLRGALFDSVSSCADVGMAKHLL